MNYSELSIKELKAIAQAQCIEVIGDKRSKATWVLALESALTQTSESIAWVIAALMPLALGVWRYLVPDPKSGESIDYFPGVPA